MVAFHGHLYAIGGVGMDNLPIGTVEQFSIAENKWTTVSIMPDGARYCHQASDNPAFLPRSVGVGRTFGCLSVCLFVCLFVRSITQNE